MNLSLFPKPIKVKKDFEKIVDFFFELKEWADMPKEFYIENQISYGRHVKPAKQLLELFNDEFEKAKEFLQRVADYCNDRGLEWSIETCFKKYLELIKEPV